MNVYIVTYNERVSTEGYDDIDKAIGFIQGRSNIGSFEAVSPMHYTNGKDNYKIHEIQVR